MDAHAYPEQLAAFVTGAWPDGADPLPPPRVLHHILSTAYQASLLRDEDRPVTFRLLVAPPSRIAVDGGPPASLHRLTLETPRPFEPHELRRLAPAAKYASALLAIDIAAAGHPGGAQPDLTIWGVLQSGTRWQQQVASEAVRAGAPEGSLVVLAQGPGRVAVACGEITLAEIRGGIITGPAFDVFESQWLSARFEAIRAELVELHREECRCDPALSVVGPEAFRSVSQRTMRRALAAIREARHGGTVLWVPPDDDGFRRYVHIKYPIPDDEARRRYRTLMLRRMRWLATATRDLAELSAIDDGIAEMSHLIASFTAVDGAVILSRRFELLGFGGEITNVPPMTSVSTALDLEGDDRVVETMDAVGTRHRTAYRFCAAVPGALAIVVSQDGGVQFVANLAGDVVRWDHTALGSIEV